MMIVWHLRGGDKIVMNEFINKKRLKQVQKMSGAVGIIFLIALFIIMVMIPAFQLLIDYIWMDTLGYGSVYTTMFMSKIVLALSVFVLFFLSLFFMLFFLLL